MIVLAASLVGLGVFAMVAGLAMRIRAKRESLRSLVEAELAEPSDTPEALGNLLARAGLLTERTLEGTSVLDRTGLMLSRAGWSIRSGEFVAVVVAFALVAGVMMWMVASLVVGVLAAGLAALGLVAYTSRKGRVRTTKLEEQLPSTLQMLAASLESGSSVLHAFELVVEEGEAPMAGELARVVTETRVGRPLLESLEAMSDRIGSRDLDWTVEAIRIQQQSGGKLADTLRVLADFMRARMEIRGEVRALSAEARLSAKVLTVLPLALAGFLFAFRRGYFEPMYATSVGRALLIVAAAGIVLGSLWMRRLVRLEV